MARLTGGNKSYNKRKSCIAMDEFGTPISRRHLLEGYRARDSFNSFSKVREIDVDTFASYVEALAAKD